MNDKPISLRGLLFAMWIGLKIRTAYEILKKNRNQIVGILWTLSLFSLMNLYRLKQIESFNGFLGLCLVTGGCAFLYDQEEARLHG